MQLYFMVPCWSFLTTKTIMGKYSLILQSTHFSSFHFLFFIFQIQVVTVDEMYTSSAPFSCSNFTSITYPIWILNSQPNYCGHPQFKLDCQNDSLTLEIKTQKFHILEINQKSQILTIVKEDLYAASSTSSCPFQYTYVNMDLNFFHYTLNNVNYTLLF